MTIHILPKGTMTMNTPQSTHAYFSLPDEIENIMNDWSRMYVAQNYAWAIDNQIQTAVREVFKTIRDECLTKTIDSIGDFYTAISEQSFAEEQFDIIGTDSAGPVRRLHEALDLRQAAWSLALTSTKLAASLMKVRPFEEQDIDKLFDGIRNPDYVAADTLGKVKQNAEYMANAAVARVGENAENTRRKTLFEEYYTNGVQRLRNENLTMQQTLKRQSGGLLMVYNIMVKARPAKMPAQAEFHQVNIDMQRALIQRAIAGTERANADAMKERQITTHAHMQVMLANTLFVDKMTEVLKSPRFNQGLNLNTIAPVTGKPKELTNKKLPKPAKPKAAKRLKEMVKATPPTTTMVGEALQAAVATS